MSDVLFMSSYCTRICSEADILSDLGGAPQITKPLNYNMIHLELHTEMRSVERGICPITSSTMNELFIIVGCIAHARNGRISTSGLKSDVTIHHVPRPQFPVRRENFGDSRTFKAENRIT